MNTTPNNLPVRVTVSEASRLFGISTKTIRQAITEGQISYIVSRGRYRLNFDSILKWSQLSTRRRNLLGINGIGRYVDKWKIANKKFSPNPTILTTPTDKK
jgi:excisionase family DNA binding protein